METMDKHFPNRIIQLAQDDSLEIPRNVTLEELLYIGRERKRRKFEKHNNITLSNYDGKVNAVYSVPDSVFYGYGLSDYKALTDLLAEIENRISALKKHASLVEDAIADLDTRI